MSFLNDLKNQARALQSQGGTHADDLQARAARVESTCTTTLHYLQDLARQLNVIEPQQPAFTLDGKTPWPAMKAVEFRVDARKKMLRGREVTDYMGMGWRIVPQIGKPVGGVVRVNFPPDLQRVEARLALGPVAHERVEIRHPEKRSLLAIEFRYLTETRGNVTITPDHDQGVLTFRLLNANGFEVRTVQRRPEQVVSAELDEMAKLIVGQPSRFA